mgnify:CR=1 FL=1
MLALAVLVPSAANAATDFGGTNAGKAEGSQNSATKNLSEIVSAEGYDVTYNIAETELKAKAWSGSDYVEKAISEGIIARKGAKFVSKAKGAEAAKSAIVFENLSGAFEMDFRVWSDYTYSTAKQASNPFNVDGEACWKKDANTTADVYEMKITLTDSDSGESLSILISNGKPHNTITPTARVAYGDKKGSVGAGRSYTGQWGDEPGVTGLKGNGGFEADVVGGYTAYNTALLGTSFCNYGAPVHNTGDTYAGNVPSLIGFDPATDKVYGRLTARWDRNGTVLRTIADLSNDNDCKYVGDSGKVLRDIPFNNYTAKIEFPEVREGASAKILIASLNGQSFGGENGVLTSDSAPVPVGRTYEAKIYESGMTAEIPAPGLCSLAERAPVFNGKVKVLNGAGATVLEETAWREGLTFSPEKADTYKIVYTSGTDAAGNTRKTYNSNYSGTIKADVKVSAECELPVVKAAVANASVSLKGNVAINYYADLSSELTGESSAATAVFKNAAGETLGEPIALNAVQAETSGEMQGKYKFSYPVAARDYQEKITLTVLENGAEIAGLSYSVNDYIVAVNAMESASAELKNAVNALKAYCEAARAYFAGETVASAEAADLSAFAGVIEKAEASEAEDADINMSLLLKSGTELRIYFKGDLDCTIGGVAAEKRAAKAEGYYYVSVEDIAAKDLGAEQVLTIGDYTIKCSALSYAAAVEGIVSEETSVVNLKNLVRALYAYYAAANAYFGANV